MGYVPARRQRRSATTISTAARSKHEYVCNLNLMSAADQNFTIVPSMRVQKEDWDARFQRASRRCGDASPAAVQQSAATGPLDVRERLDLRYTGVTNWVFYGRRRVDRGQGNLNENGGLSQVNGIGVRADERETDDALLPEIHRRRPLVSRAAYPGLRRLLQEQRYDYDHHPDSTPNDELRRTAYPAYLVCRISRPMTATSA